MTLSLGERTAALADACDAADGRLDGALVDASRAVVRRVRERGGLSAEHTVVALAGATGSGKSSLFNAIAGSELADVGIRRPTTSHAQAAVWGDGAEELLDWLEVRRRHGMGGPLAAGPLTPDRGRRRARRATASGPGGLVLLDLPDHDSVITDHRLRAEHLVGRADLLVWVVDPQKYADAALHETYLRPLAGRDSVVVVVLNQVDRLTAEEQVACLADLRRLVALDGLTAARVLGVSARTGAGLDELRGLLAQAAERREAATARLEADVRAVATDLVAACGSRRGPESGSPRRADAALTAALEDAAGVGVVVDAVARSFRQDAHAATGWPVTRWIGRFRADPLRRLGLRRAAPAAPGGSRPDLLRTSLPTASPASRAAASSAVRAYARDATAGLPQEWAIRARERAQAEVPSLPDALDVAVAGVDLGASRRPRWWRVVGAAQWVVLAAAFAGVLWLGVLALLAYLRLPEPPTPEWQGWPVPTLLVIGGVVLGLLVALASRAAAAVGSRRRAARARRLLRAAVDVVATDRVRAGVREELTALARCREQAARAAS